MSAFSTCLNLSLDSNWKCETDFVWMLNHDGRPSEIVIGEIKTKGAIEVQDAKNLAAVAERLRAVNMDVYIVFAKLNRFSADEIAACRIALHDSSPRVIMLTQAELEPYEIPDEGERAWAETVLGRLALGSHSRYFDEQDEEGQGV